MIWLQGSYQMLIKTQKIPKKEISVDDTLATFCYKYQQYTLSQAEKLPYKHVIKMLQMAKKQEAQKMLELVNIVASPHTKKGQGIKSIIEFYRRILDE